MASRNGSPNSKKGASLSVMLGTLLVPLSAFAASTLVDSSGPDESATSTESSLPASATAVTIDPTAADLETACGEAGLAMVAAETAGAISDLQQAALDALRGICAEQGMPLQASQAPQPDVTAPTQPSAPSSGQIVGASDDDDHYGRHGGDHDDEDDHGRHGDDEDEHGRHGGDHDDEDDHGRHGGDHE